jgi:hypothetical protein
MAFLRKEIVSPISICTFLLTVQNIDAILRREDLTIVMISVAFLFPRPALSYTDMTRQHGANITMRSKLNGLRFYMTELCT